MLALMAAHQGTDARTVDWSPQNARENPGQYNHVAVSARYDAAPKTLAPSLLIVFYLDSLFLRLRVVQFWAKEDPPFSKWRQTRELASP